MYKRKVHKLGDLRLKMARRSEAHHYRMVYNVRPRKVLTFTMITMVTTTGVSNSNGLMKVIILCYFRKIICFIYDYQRQLQKII